MFVQYEPRNVLLCFVELSPNVTVVEILAVNEEEVIHSVMLIVLSFMCDMFSSILIVNY